MKNSNPGSSAARPLGKRVALILLSLLLVLLVTGYLYENISEARDRRFNPMPGRLVDVGGHRMHIYCTGDGSPTVVLDSGLGDSYLSWHKVQAEIAKFTRVCSYDRAGLGYSDAGLQPRTSRVIAEELHVLLQAAGVAPPYVIAGHSMGGFNVRLYTSMYPKEIAGMVLVDASHPEQENRFPPELKNMEGSWHQEAEFIAYTMPFGIPRLLGLCDEGAIDRAADCNGHTARERMAEIQAFPESAVQAASTGPFGDLPLAVLSHDQDKFSNDLPTDLAKSVNQLWETMQEDLAHLSTRGTQIVAKNSGHYIQMDRPDVVVDAIRKVVEQRRGTQPKP
ncbi:MAG TPA: alpha/beta hydrolase [Candidatus Sulfotelmatobacter sp.]|nr:alpha/beta hydrolase [Candidatus Sulfotelmatobacter sp.]